MSVQHDKAAKLFDAAVELTDLAQRAAFLDAACGQDQALRAEVEQLLAHDAAAGSFLQSAADAPDKRPTQVHEPPSLQAEQVGALIAGRYKLLEPIGEGGMGTVWVAEQTRPVRRKVALKLVKAGMNSKAVLARFEVERQALALMDHPNIAKVLDGGTTDSGRPFFVMEHVKGIPFTKYCDDARLSVEERLALFMPVCHAVQHAHQKGIIHRDLKPSNILVCLYDGVPIPKVIDFGLAKAMYQPLTEHTLHTAQGLMMGTPLYMSPEQAELNNLDVDTRTDIYSLGVILYELLTGTTPLERNRLKEAAWQEMFRLIKEEEPLRPSMRLSGSGTLPSVAAQRKLEPAKLTKLVRGDLDWIVMKALDKERGRRYETANGLARDLQNYLADEPVEAMPPSASYRLRKFARKHKKALVTTVTFVVLLVAGLVVSTLLAVWATSAEFEANRQRIASDEAKQEAVEARVEADKQRNEARLNAYATGMGLAQNAWNENNVVRARELLADVPGEAAGKDLRGFEWYYLSRLCKCEELNLKGHVGPVNGVSFSPDGQRLVSVGRDQTVKIWSIPTGTVLNSLEDHTEEITCVTFSPDGKRLASGSVDETVKVWDAATGQVIRTLKGRTGVVCSVSFSPDSQRLASASRTMVKIWDMATGEELLSFKANSGRSSVSFSPDGRRLASGSADNTVKIWDSMTGKELVPLKGHARSVESVSFSPDGRRLASAGWDNTVKIWDSATGQELASLKGHASTVNSVTFSPDGRRLASGSEDYTVKIWDSATGKELVSYKGRAGPIMSVAFSPDGERLAFSNQNDFSISLWESIVPPKVRERRAAQHVDDPWSLYLAGNLLGQKGQFTDAIAVYKKAIALKPDFAMAHLKLALALLADAHDPKLALFYAKNAVGLAPIGDNWNTLGVAHYRNGDWKAALEALNKAAKLRKLSNDANCDHFFELAKTHWKLGDKEEARISYDKGVEAMRKWFAVTSPLAAQTFERYRAEAAELLGIEPPANPSKDAALPKK
jgi:WD40 repeat protein/serine/threonine protein kinase